MGKFYTLYAWDIGRKINNIRFEKILYFPFTAAGYNLT